VGSFDRELRSALSYTTNCNFTDTSWLQASLPARFGGLGIQCARNLDAAAYLEYLQASEQLSAVILSPMAGLIQNGLKDSWRNIVGSSIALPASTTSQRGWTQPVYRVLLDSLIVSSSGADRAWLLAVSSPYTGVWINAFPSHSLGLRMGNDETRIAIGLCAGVNLVLPHSFVCGVSVASDGQHGLSCRQSMGRHSRHSAINRIIVKASQAAGTPMALEPPGLVMVRDLMVSRSPHGPRVTH